MREVSFEIQIPTMTNEVWGTRRPILCFKDSDESLVAWCRWQNWLMANPLPKRDK